MNSNELADRLENASNISEVARLVKENVIPMLRYQQASIDRLLNTKKNPLTDEDLFKVYVDLQENYTGNNFPVDLGRSILRKAQEK